MPAKKHGKQSSEWPNPGLRMPKQRGDPKSDAQKPPSGANPNPEGVRRQGSKVSPRKVSEGLKQLPRNSYRFVRESYNLLDSDGSGSVSRETLRDMLSSLGLSDRGDKLLNEMLERAGDPVEFSGYLAVVGELLGDLPSQEEMSVMLEAFQKENGQIDEPDLRSALRDEGLTDAEIESVMTRFSKPSRFGRVFDASAFAAAMSI